MMDDILWAKENQRIMAVVAIDLSAAFDTVDHDILVSSAGNLGYRILPLGGSTPNISQSSTLKTPSDSSSSEIPPSTSTYTILNTNTHNFN